MKRELGVLLAVIVITAGAVLAGVGALGLSIFGTEGTYAAQSRTVAATPESMAVIADLTGVDVGLPFHEQLGTATLTAQSADGAELFVGQADQAAVDKYLFGVPYDLATKSGSWTLTAVPGLNTTIEAPQDQSFWLQSATGSAATLQMQDGKTTQTLVIMRADGQPGIDSTITLGFTGEQIGPASIAAVAAGLSLVVLTFMVLMVLRRRRRRRERAAAAARQAAAAQPAIDLGEEPVVDLAEPGPQPVTVDNASGASGQE